jgi:alginate O-acetyltransferase complex protein AlgI
MAMGGWVLFRSETFTQAWGYYKALLGFSQGSPKASAIWLYNALDVQTAIVMGILFSAPIIPALSRWWQRQLSDSAQHPLSLRGMILQTAELGRTLVLLGMLLLCFLPLASGTHNPFIYFRF